MKWLLCKLSIKYFPVYITHLTIKWVSVRASFNAVDQLQKQCEKPTITKNVISLKRIMQQEQQQQKQKQKKTSTSVCANNKSYKFHVLVPIMSMH